jgi:hypothetical protein
MRIIVQIQTKARSLCQFGMYLLRFICIFQYIYRFFVVEYCLLKGQTNLFILTWSSFFIGIAFYSFLMEELKFVMLETTAGNVNNIRSSQ